MSRPFGRRSRRRATAPFAVLSVAVLLVASLVVPVAAAGSSAVKTASSVGPAAAGSSRATAATSSQAGEDIRLENRLSLTPDRPGEIRVEAQFSLPDRVTGLRVRLPPDAVVTGTDGFSRVDGSTYAWDGQTATPRLTYRLPVNHTDVEAGRLPVGGRLHLAAARADRGSTTRAGTRTAAHAGAETATHAGTGPAASAAGAIATPGGEDATAAAAQPDGGYLFVDVGPWALVPLPASGVHWSYRGAPVGITRDATVEGRGAVGGRTAFLGAHRTYERTAHGQTFRLVVPATAQLAVAPDAVLDAMANASDALRVGDRDETVFVVAAPTDTDWAVLGIQTGDADVWVRADQPLASPDNPWIHEYVHTRQAFEPTTGTRWLVEGSADYYAAWLSLREGLIDFEEFRHHLALGSREPYASVVLSRPDTWVRGAQYRKGGLVAGVVDRRIRLASDGGATFGTVFSRLNARDDPATVEAFLGYVGEAGNASVRTAADRYSTTSAAPEAWTRAEHAAAFGERPARVAYDLPAAVHVAGPYRNATLDPPATVVPGEVLRIPVTVTNAGGTAGDYLVELAVANRTVATRTGRIAPGNATTVTLAYEFDEPGRYDVRVRDRTYRVSVREPATPDVARVAANESRIPAGASVLVTATVSNDAGIPAEGSVSIRLDGERVRTERVTLAPGGETTLRVVLSPEAPGTYRVAVGDRSVAFVVTLPETGGAGPVDGTPVAIPGFGPAAALVAVAAAALVSTRGGRRDR